MRVFWSILVASLVLAVGCAGDDDDDDSSSPGDGYGDACDGGLPTWTAALADANNYAYDVVVDIATYPVAENTDITIEWTSLTQDMWGLPLGPRQVETLSLVAFGLALEEVEVGLEQDTLEQADVMLYVFTDVLGQSSVEFSRLTLFGTEIDLWEYFDSSYAATWLLTLSSGDTPGVDTLSAAFLVPTPDETTTLVSITNDTAKAEADADLVSLDPVDVPACSPLHLDWEDVTTDGQGGSFEFHHVDNRFLAYFPDAEPAALQADALSWKQTAADLWENEVVMGEQSATLDGDLSAAGTPFEGITTEGTWLFGLECTSCFTPMPKFLTILAVD